MWQPMETAPKDGTWIIVYEKNVVSYNAKTKIMGWANEPYIHIVRWSKNPRDYGFSYWDTIEIGPDSDTYSPCPAGWMPLPEPPK